MAEGEEIEKNKEETSEDELYNIMSFFRRDAKKVRETIVSATKTICRG